MAEPESAIAAVSLRSIPQPQPVVLPKARRLTWRRMAAVLVSVSVTLGIIWMAPQFRHFAVYGYPGIFLITLIGNATVILPAPAFLVAMAAGAVLNPVVIGVVAGLGSSLGELTGYLAGVGGRGVVENRAVYGRIEKWMRKSGMLVIFLLAVLPNPFFDIGGMCAGALGMPVWRFLLACWAGKSVRFFALAMGGSGVQELLTSSALSGIVSRISTVF
jgi:membrane protein YqaA with SNARE-associated domain